MQLHQLKPSHKKKEEKRIGRGGKRGTYSGRGQKGQRARAGRRIPDPKREVILRLPKLRGVKQRFRKGTPVVLNVGLLEGLFPNTLVSRQSLLKRGIINRIGQDVKILGKGDVRKAFTIQGIKVSKEAREKIEKAGGIVK